MKSYRIGLLFFLALVMMFAHIRNSTAQESNHAGLVVQFGDGSIETRCVEFAESNISGLELLERSGLPILAAYDPSMGAMVCKIQEQGCPVDNCLCESPPDYWSYWHQVDNNWIYSPAGSSTYQVFNGAVEGWSWGPGNPPPMITISEICAPPATATPTNTNIPTSTPVTPTATPDPTDTLVPTETPEQAPTTDLPPTDTPVPPTESDTQSDEPQESTHTPDVPTETLLPTFTSLPTETPTLTLPTDLPASTDNPQPSATFAIAQGPYPDPYPYPYPPPPMPEVTKSLPTSLPAYPYPAYPEPDAGLIAFTPTPTYTPTLVPAYIPPTEDAPAENLLDRISSFIRNIRYPLLWVAWFFCGGTIGILLFGWIAILILLRRN
jgi:hypothetical protein